MEHLYYFPFLMLLVGDFLIKRRVLIRALWGPPWVHPVPSHVVDVSNAYTAQSMVSQHRKISANKCLGYPYGRQDCLSNGAMMVEPK